MNAPNLDLQFHALSDATRRALVERLSHGPTSVTALAEPMAVSLPTVLKHLAILEAGSIVISEKQGRVRTFRVAPDAFADLERWMDERKRMWNRRFDKLEQYLDGGIIMTGSSTIHSTFVIEREFKVPPQKVFASWASVEAKRVWMSCDDAAVTQSFEMDFRPGGRETNSVAFPGGEMHRFDGYYLDIVPGRRIIYAFDMHVGAKRISASLATVVFEAQGSGTKMVFTEQIAFLDGYSDREERIRGTEIGLDKLQLSLMPHQNQTQ